MPYYFLLALFFLIACNKEQEQLQQDVDLIKEYIQSNNLQTMMQDPDASFFYGMLHESSDTISPVRYAGLQVEVDYKSYLLDGTLLFDSNGQSTIVELDEAIVGWQLAMPLMDLNDKMLLILPSRLAYGVEGNNQIPPNSILVFEIELLDIFPHF